MNWGWEINLKFKLLNLDFLEVFNFVFFLIKVKDRLSKGDKRLISVKVF